MAITICDDCKKKAFVATADFGGKFNCVICGNVQTMVASIGHGKVCNECQKEGYCKYCGKEGKKVQDKFLEDIKNVYGKYIDKMSLNELMNINDLYIDTMKKEIKK